MFYDDIVPRSYQRAGLLGPLKHSILLARFRTCPMPLAARAALGAWENVRHPTLA